MTTANEVTRTASAAPADALAHFEAHLGFETDCWDVHSTQQDSDRGFVLFDVRSSAAFEASHLPGAQNVPHVELTEARLASYPMDTLFVVYCAGPHCNGAHKAAVRLARLGRPVKVMIGGVEGWRDEGFAFAPGGRDPAGHTPAAT